MRACGDRWEAIGYALSLTQKDEKERVCATKVNDNDQRIQRTGFNSLKAKLNRVNNVNATITERKYLTVFDGNECE